MCLKPRDALPEGLQPVDHVVELIDDLSAAMVNVRIYSPDHPRVRDSIDSAWRFLGELPWATEEHALRLSIVDDLIVYRGQPLVGASLTASRLVQTLTALGCGGIEIDRTASAQDLYGLLVRIAGVRGAGSYTAVNTELAAAGVQRARLLPPFVETEAGALSFSSGLSAPVRFYRTCLDLLQDVIVSICHGGKIDFGPVNAQAEAVLRHLEQDDAPLMNLARQDQYDAFTFGHSVRVAVLATTFARAMTNDRELALRVGAAALLHDCGKALVPFEILHSRKALSDEERLEMNRHAQFGAEILLDHAEADPLAIAAAFGHHRSCDGTGYPTTRHEHQNLVVTEIVKICDIYEALTAARPYKRPMSPVRAYRVMISMGEHVDRALLKRFIRVNGIHPTGQLVELSDGSRGRVVGQTDAPLSPRVQLVYARGGELLDAARQLTLDMRAERADRGLHVIGTATDELALPAARS